MRTVRARLKGNWGMPELNIRVVPDEYGACPRCGAYWGNKGTDKAGNPLDFPNRQKVDNAWRCYNPNCTCGYYDPDLGEVLEDKPSPEKAAEIAAKVRRDMDALSAANRWITKGNTSRMIPNDAPLPEGWHEMKGRG